MSCEKELNLILNKHGSIAGNLQQSERAKDIRAHPKSTSNQPDLQLIQTSTSFINYFGSESSSGLTARRPHVTSSIKLFHKRNLSLTHLLVPQPLGCILFQHSWASLLHPPQPCESTSCSKLSTPLLLSSC